MNKNCTFQQFRRKENESVQIIGVEFCRRNRNKSAGWCWCFDRFAASFIVEAKTIISVPCPFPPPNRLMRDANTVGSDCNKQSRSCGLFSFTTRYETPPGPCSFPRVIFLNFIKMYLFFFFSMLDFGLGMSFWSIFFVLSYHIFRKQLPSNNNHDRETGNMSSKRCGMNYEPSFQTINANSAFGN